MKIYALLSVIIGASSALAAPLWVKKNPSPYTLIARVYSAECPPGYEPSTEAAAAAWEQEQLTAGWTPAPQPAPVLAVPAEVTRRQLFLALLEKSPTLTRAAIRAQLTTESALVEFDEAMDFKRNHPLIAQLATALGFTAADIDQVFSRAAQL